MNGLPIYVILLLGAGVLAAAIAWAADADTPSLPAAQTEGGMSLVEALAARRSVRAFKPDVLTAQQIAQLCWAAQGVSDERRALRTAPSAGALYPLEVYVVTVDGVDHYDPAVHTLARHVNGDLRTGLQTAALGQSCVGQAPATFVITAVVARTERKYGRRAERYVWIEAGHAGQNLLLQAAAMELGAVPVGAFDDAAVAKAISLPADHAPLYLIPLGHTR